MSPTVTLSRSSPLVSSSSEVLPASSFFCFFCSCSSSTAVFLLWWQHTLQSEQLSRFPRKWRPVRRAGGFGDVAGAVDASADVRLGFEELSSWAGALIERAGCEKWITEWTKRKWMNGFDGVYKSTHHHGVKKKKRMATKNATTAKVDYWYVTPCCEFSNHANCY